MKTLDQIANHLEFFGYKIEFSSDPEKLYFAIHPEKNNLSCLEIHDGFVLFKITLITNKQLSQEVSAFVNHANQNLNITKVYIVEELEKDIVTIDVSFEAVYVGKYNKEMFGQFFNLLENDVRKFHLFDDFKSIFLS